MYVNSEKDLEDYICNNIDEFIKFLQGLYIDENLNVENIEFVGRQIVVGDSRFDLLFEIQEKIDDEFFEIERTFIVVELKFRKAEPKDIAQLSRYLNLLKSLEYDKRVGSTLVEVKGILLTEGLNAEMQDIQMYLNDYTNTDIKFVHINTNINFEEDSYSYKPEYLENMSVDKRLRNVKQEVITNGEKENDRP